MGKGTIISGGTDGFYQVQINFNQEAYTARIVAFDATIAQYDVEIAAWTGDAAGLAALELGKASAEVSKAYLIANTPSDETVGAWCADITEDLSGEVGTIEIPGESGTYNIQPGHEANAVYDAARDGQLVPTIAMTSAAAFYNLAMLPGWQKWMPTYRYGVISGLSGDTCTVTLEAAISSQQGIDVNQNTVLSGVSIEYMNCNGSAFEDGDSVLVQFVGQDFAAPKVIGFKEWPQRCGGNFLYCEYDTSCFVWDLETNAYPTIVRNNDGDLVTSWPALISDISNFINSFTTISTAAINTEQIKPIAGPVIIPTVTEGSESGCYLYETGPDDETKEIVGWDINGPANEDATNYLYQRTLKEPHLEIAYVRSWVDTRTRPFSTGNIVSRGVYAGPLSYKITSASSVGGVRARTISTTYEDESYEAYGQPPLPSPPFTPPCTSAEIPSMVSQAGEQEIIQTFSIKSPFSDLSTVNIEIEETSYVLCTSVYLYGGNWIGTNSCTVSSIKEELVNEKYYVATGILGNLTIPYMVVFYHEDISVDKYPERAAGMITPISNSAIETKCNGVICTMNDIAWGTPSSVEKSSIVKVFSQKAGEDESVDPMNLNPFGIGENSSLTTAMTDFFTACSVTNAAGVSLTFLNKE